MTNNCKTINWRQIDSALKRRECLVDLYKLSVSDLDPNPQSVLNQSNSSIEQPFSVSMIPMGIAGPLLFTYQSKSLIHHIPLATTEAALVASIQRGCKAITLSKSATAISTDDGMTRAPVFTVNSLEHGNQVISWITSHHSSIAKVAASQSKHLKLKTIQPYLLGRYLYLRLVFNTGSAMGMNMATFASQRIADFLYQKIKLQCIALSSNLCTDKKPSYINPIMGRGIKAQAEVILPNKVITEVLKTTPQAIIDIIHTKQYLGSSLGGSMGSNAQVANTIAAIFLATGQDMAHIVDSSIAYTTAQITKKDLYLSLLIPNLIIGTFGGGTRLPTQKACLKILKLDKAKDGDKEKFGAIIATTALAAEISLTAALAAGDLAKAHQHLSNPRRWKK